VTKIPPLPLFKKNHYSTQMMYSPKNLKINQKKMGKCLEIFLVQIRLILLKFWKKSPYFSYHKIGEKPLILTSIFWGDSLTLFKWPPTTWAWWVEVADYKVDAYLTWLCAFIGVIKMVISSI